MVHVVILGAFPQDPAVIKGGVQASVYGLSVGLLKRTDINSVEVFSLPITAAAAAVYSTTVSGIPVIYLNAPHRFLISSTVHITRVLRTIAQKPSPVVHVHGTGLFQTLLMLCMRLRRTPFVWTLHVITEKETLQDFRTHRSASNLGRYLLYTFLERLSLRIAPETIIDTPYVRDALPPGRLHRHVIPQGIFIDEFTGMPRERASSFLVVAVGVCSPRKSHHLTLEAFARVKKQVPAARLVIAGASPTPQYHKTLLTRVAELGLQDAVDIRVNIQRHEILALLSEAKVFALHSQEESQGIALCEALIAGLPVVATRVGGIPFVVEDQKDGFLVPYGDIAGFADAIVRLLTDDLLYDAMATQAALSGKRFDWDSVCDEVVRIYSRIGRIEDATAEHRDENREHAIQFYTRAGWTWNAATNTLTHPTDPDLHVELHPGSANATYSSKLAKVINQRVTTS